MNVHPHPYMHKYRYSPQDETIACAAVFNDTAMWAAALRPSSEDALATEFQRLIPDMFLAEWVVNNEFETMVMTKCARRSLLRASPPRHVPSRMG